jgi:dienelactone hydrolase
MTAFAARAKHPELATAPFLLWGMSAGGEFNYEFVCWKPERVVAFVVNKGNIYYTALAPKAARGVPGILFTGGKDLEFRTSTITGLFAMNRRGGALWALAEEPSAAHVVGRSRDVAMVLFEDALALRLGDASTLKPMTESAGFLGDIKAKTFQALGESKVPNYPTAWLPTARVAERWQWLVTEKP